MKSDILKFFNLQRQIFGICPNCGQFFRLSDCKVYVKTRPTKDWMDKLNLKAQRLEAIEERIDEQEESLREKAREKGRKEASQLIRKIDRVFTPRRLNPDDAKVVFHPIDYVVFNGMKNGNSIKSIVMLDRQTESLEHRRLQKSIERLIERGNYDWLTLRVLDDGSIKEE
jgi:Predicted secreted endonuclease distantly related to archaeal Holliday junction resolvase